MYFPIKQFRQQKVPYPNEKCPSLHRLYHWNDKLNKSTVTKAIGNSYEELVVW